VPSGLGPTASPAQSLSAATLDAVRFRTAFGLVADLDFIAQVARDPTAKSDYWVPLMPEELAHVLRLQSDAEAAASLLDAYGEQHPDEFAGWFGDDIQRGVYVALFTANLQDHVRGLWGTLLERTPPIAVQVKPARYTFAELHALQVRIEHDMPMWAERGIQIVAIAMRVPLNVEEIWVLAPAPTAEKDLAAAYGSNAIKVYVSDTGPQVG
jgi:hypothetical protein